MNQKIKVLNLYSCLGGNRLLWENCDVTAVELDPELASLYAERFPNDIGDRNFKIATTKNEVKELCKFHKFDFTKYKGEQRIDKIARNLVDYEAGKTIFNTAMNIIEKSKINQFELF